MSSNWPVTKNGKVAGGHQKTPDKVIDDQTRFLEAYASCGVVRKAATDTHISTATVSRWLDQDIAFRERFYYLRDGFIGKLECEANHRALNGSDSLLMFMLKANDPETYNPMATIKAQANAGDAKAQIVIQFNSDILTDEEVALIGKGPSNDNESSSTVRSESDAEIIPQIKGKV